MTGVQTCALPICRWLEIGVIDASQSPLWRKRLFASNVNDTFSISASDTSGLPEMVAAAVRRYELHFSVRKAESSEAESWLSEGGAVIFKFWATAYPTVCAYTGNDPSVI